MAKNEFNINRVAFGNFTYPATVNSTLAASVEAGGYIPKGAIVTGITTFQYGAFTQAASLGNAVFSVVVGGQQIATNDRKVTEAFIQTKANTVAVAAAGMYISVGGPIIVSFTSTDSARAGVVFNADIYVEYLYCGDRDIA
jgi:hypothetical protein